MTSHASSLTSSSSRPLGLRMRPDLDAHEQVYEGRRFWVVKDPLTLRYFRFQEEEFTILAWLDGKLSLAELRQNFERRFAPQKITTAELHQFISTLYRASLVISEAPGQGEVLIERHGERARDERKQWWGNLLAIRFRGFNPDALLTTLEDHVGWLFSPAAIGGALMLACCALLLVLVQFDTFRARLPGFHEFFSLQNWFWLSLTLAATKILHEFGHGLACKRLGRECHEMGLMLLVFSPCLYANVSDAWTLPSKWQRAAVGAAGMYAEMILASVATLVWWSTQPGLVHYLALNVMFVCSVSTLLFNANPLMRFDGYYILSDLCEIPNLRSKATRILRGKLGAWLLGVPLAHDPFLPQRKQLLFAIYAVAAAAYSWLITASILWTLLKMFEPYGLKVLGQLLAAVALFALLVLPLVQLIRFLIQAGRAQRVNVPRAFVSLSLVTGVVVAVAWLPLPRYVTCSALVEPREATAVYVDVPGEVREVLATPYTQVATGEPILRLANVDLELAISRLEGEREQMAARLTSLHERAILDDNAAQLVAHTEEALAALGEQLERKHVELRRLTIVAPASGTLTPPAPRSNDTTDARLLPNWSGHPLEVRNVGARLETGVIVGQIGDPSVTDVVLAIDETEIDFVRTGQTVDIVLDQLPGERLRTTLATLSAEELAFAPRSLSAKHGGILATRTDAQGREVPLATTYQAGAPLENAGGRIIAGARGQARIYTGTETLGRRLWREACRTLAWDL